MAKFLNISTSYYSQLENGKRKLDYVMAVKISSIFKMYPDDIFYDEHINDRVVIYSKKKKITTHSYFGT